MVDFNCAKKREIELETTPNSAACALASLAWVSNPPSETDHTLVGAPAEINLDTTSNCCARSLSPPALPPFTVGKSITAGAGAFKIGVTVEETENRLRIEVAAAAISAESVLDLLASFKQF